MPAYVRCCTFGLVVFCILVCVSLPAVANSVSSVAATGYVDILVVLQMASA